MMTKPWWQLLPKGSDCLDCSFGFLTVRLSGFAASFFSYVWSHTFAVLILSAIVKTYFIKQVELLGTGFILYNIAAAVSF